MPKPLIALPCTARELENVLHSYCDHHGAWDATVGIYGLDLIEGQQTTGLCLTTETKGEEE